MMDRYIKFTCFTSIIVAVITGKLCKKLPYGSPCSTDAECRDEEIGRKLFSDKYVNIFTDDVHSMCDKVNKRCNCSLPQNKEFKNNNYVCARALHVHFGDAPNCKLDDPETCVNGVCKKDILRGDQCICNDGFIYVRDKCREIVNVNYSEDCKTPKSGSVPLCNYSKFMHCNSDGKCGCITGYFYDKEKKTCISKEAYIEKYPEEIIAGLYEFCGTSSIPNRLPKFCDERANMFCGNRKCKCTKEYYPVHRTKTCESKESYAMEHNLPSYKVLTAGYCFDDDDCFPGLTCYASNKCYCPHPSSYDYKNEVCVYPEESLLEVTKPYLPVIVVGSIGGVVIIALVIKAILVKRSMVIAKRKCPTKPSGNQAYKIKSNILGGQGKIKIRPRTRFVPLPPITTEDYSLPEYPDTMPPTFPSSDVNVLPDYTDSSLAQIAAYSTDPSATVNASTDSPYPFKPGSGASPDYSSDPASAYNSGEEPSTYDIYKPIIS